MTKFLDDVTINKCTVLSRLETRLEVKRREEAILNIGVIFSSEMVHVKSKGTETALSITTSTP